MKFCRLFAHQIHKCWVTTRELVGTLVSRQLFGWKLNFSWCYGELRVEADPRHEDDTGNSRYQSALKGWKCFKLIKTQISSALTFALIHGKKIPIVKIPNKGPFVIASKLIVNCSTVPSFSTTYTMHTQKTPSPTTTDLITQFTWFSVSGFFTYGFTKSSSTTADIELRHVESELSAAENTPAMKRPLKPGSSPSVSITKSGSIWSFTFANLVVRGSQCRYVAYISSPL